MSFIKKKFSFEDVQSLKIFIHQRDNKLKYIFTFSQVCLFSVKWNIFHLSSLWNTILTAGLVITGLVSQWSVGWFVSGFNKTAPGNPRTWKTHLFHLSMTVSLSKNCESFTSYYGMTLHQVVEVTSQLARGWCHEFNNCSALQSWWNKKERHRKIYLNSVLIWSLDSSELENSQLKSHCLARYWNTNFCKVPRDIQAQLCLVSLAISLSVAILPLRQPIKL